MLEVHNVRYFYLTFKELADSDCTPRSQCRLETFPRNRLRAACRPWVGDLCCKYRPQRCRAAIASLVLGVSILLTHRRTADTTRPTDQLILFNQLLWLGLSAVQWVSSMVWEKVPLTMAAIHAGDWLMKLVVISAIVGAWRR